MPINLSGILHEEAKEVTEREDVFVAITHSLETKLERLLKMSPEF